MEMQANEIDVLAFLYELYQLVELVIGDSELVFVESCGNVFVRMCVNVRID